MEFNIDEFIDNLSKDLLWIPSEEYLVKIVKIVEGSTNATSKFPFKALIGLCYFNFPRLNIDPLLIKRISILLRKYTESDPDTLNQLIKEIRPLLVNPKKTANISSSGRYQKDTTTSGLRPRLGFADMSEDVMWAQWRDSGGMRSLGLFYSILTNLKDEQFSENLWWITPGLVNLMKDTTLGSSNVKLDGVFLLRTFLQASEHAIESKKFVFSNTGLYKLYEPMLKSFTYTLPPSVESSETLRTWEMVYPTLILLAKAEFFDDNVSYLEAVGSMYSENILQLTIPRIGCEYPELAKWLLSFSKDVVALLSINTTIYLQRIIYVFGEAFIRNVFITLDMDILESCIELLTQVALQSIPKSVVNQRFDMLACLLIAFEKAVNEGTLNPGFESCCLKMFQALKSCGCDFTNELNALTNRKALLPLLKQII